MTIREAAELWIRYDMIPIPEPVVEKLFKISEGADINELTPPALNNRVTYPVRGEIVDVQQNPDGEYSYLVREDGDPDSEEFYPAGIIEVERDDYLPMWGTLWAFNDSLDVDWLDDPDNLQAMANWGSAYMSRRTSAICSVSTAPVMTSTSNTGFRFTRLAG